MIRKDVVVYEGDQFGTSVERIECDQCGCQGQDYVDCPANVDDDVVQCNCCTTCIKHCSDSVTEQQ